MNKIKNIYISYWFKNLKFNPQDKVEILAKEINSIIDTPLLFNTDKSLKNISIPRIEGLSSNKKYFFNMSLINAVLSININDDLDNDEVILLINNNIQLIFDILKNVYDINYIYTSIKLEYLNNEKEVKNKLVKLLNLSEENYEDLSFKRGIIKDNYYINYLITYSKEYNFSFEKGEELNENDLFDKSMITSLKDAKYSRELLLVSIEINDRYAYNVDSSHLTSKEDLRGMIIKLKEIINNKLYWKL